MAVVVASGCSGGSEMKEAPEVPEVGAEPADFSTDRPAPSWSASTPAPQDDPREPSAADAQQPRATGSTQAVAAPVEAARVELVELPKNVAVDGDGSEWGAVPSKGSALRIAFGREGAFVWGRLAQRAAGVDLELSFGAPPEPPVGLVLSQGFFPMTAENCGPRLASLQTRASEPGGATAPNGGAKKPAAAIPKAPRPAPITEKACRDELGKQLAVLGPVLERFDARYSIASGGVQRAAGAGPTRPITGAKASLVAGPEETSFEAFVPLEALPLRSAAPKQIQLGFGPSSSAGTLPSVRLDRATELGYAPVITAGLAPFFETLESGELTQLYAVAPGAERDRVLLVGAPYKPNKQAPLKSAVREFVVERTKEVAQDGALRVVLVSTNGVAIVAVERDGRVVSADLGNAATITPKPGLAYEVLGHVVRPAGIDVLVKVSYQLPWNTSAESVSVYVLRAGRDFSLTEVASTSSSSAWARGTVGFAITPDLSTVRITGKNAEDVSKPLTSEITYDAATDRYATP